VSNKLNLLAPVISIQSAKTMVAAGADELFIAMDDPQLKNITFTVRSKKCHGMMRTCVSREDFSEIVKIAHGAGIKVNLVANIPALKIPMEGASENHRVDMSKLYLEMVQRGEMLGADAVIVGGVTPLLKIKKSGIDLPIHAGTFFNVFNSGQVHFLKDLGVKRITYPFNITLAEIKKLTLIKGLEHEVFGHFSCSAVNGLCFLTHSVTEELTTYMSCRNRYNVNSSFCDLKHLSFFKVNLECSICSLSEFINLNIHGIKIVGREIPLIMSAPIVKMYRKCIDALYGGASSEDLKRLYVVNSPFWLKEYCSHHSCKYIPSEHLQPEI